MENQEKLIEPIDETDEQVIEERSWWNRTFSSLQKDSLRGGIFTMLLTALGTGMFTLHHLYNDIGVVWTILVLAIFGLNYVYAMRVQIYAASAVKTSVHSLNDLVRHYLGKPTLILFNVIFFIYNMIALISLILAITKTFYINFEPWVWQWVTKVINVSKEKQDYGHFNMFAVWIVGLFLFSLTIQRSVDALRYFSLVSFFVFVGIIAVVVVQTPAYYQENKTDNSFNLTDFSIYNFLCRFGLAVYSFNCVTNFYGIYNSVHNPSPRRLNKIFRRTFLILFFLFVAYGLASYLSLGRKFADETDLFIFRKQIGESDVFIRVFRAMLVCSLFIGFALNVFPLKMMTFDVLKIETAPRNNFFVSLFYTAMPVLIAGFFTKITQYANLGGCFSAMFIAFIIPGLFGIKVQYHKNRLFFGLHCLWLTAMIALAIAGTVMAIRNFESK